MATETVKINGTDYTLQTLTRGQARFAKESGDDDRSADALVQMTVGKDYNIDVIPMPDFTEIAAWAVVKNGLDGQAIERAKKNYEPSL